MFVNDINIHMDIIARIEMLGVRYMVATRGPEGMIGSRDSHCTV